jgi:cohesin complex subunit SA-1/2
MQAYEAMWDDVTRQFLRHTDDLVLREVVGLIRRMNSTTALDATNQTKFENLKESLSVTLQEALFGKDLAMDSLEDEELQNIESGLLRVRTLMAQYNVDSLFSPGESEQDDDKIDLFDVLLALASRGKLGYRSEVKVSVNEEGDECRHTVLSAPLDGNRSFNTP